GVAGAWDSLERVIAGGRARAYPHGLEAGPPPLPLTVPPRGLAAAAPGDAKGRPPCRGGPRRVSMLRTRPTLPSRLSPLLVLLAGLMVSVTLTPSLARAQGADTVLWVNPNGGNWSDASNWSPANVPDAVNEVAVMKPLSSAYVVTLDHDATTGGLRIDNGASLIVDGKILTLEGIVINSGALRMIHSATVHVDRPLVQNHGGQIIAGPGGGSLLIKMPFDTGGTLDCT